MEQRPSPLVAAGFMITAAALIAGTSLTAKLAGQDILGPALHPLQVSHGRFLFAFIGLAAVAGALRLRIEAPNLRLHAARSLAGWGGVSLMFAAVTFIPLADATAISFLNPVFAMIFAVLALGERVGPWRWFAAATALAGGLILLRPGPGSFQPAALLALAAAVVMGVEITIIKFLSGREKPLQILFINNAIGLTIATLAVVWVWRMPTPGQWAALAATGGMMAVAQTCYIQGLRRADASFAVPFTYATLIFAALYDFAVFRVVPLPVSLAGAALIIAGAALLAWRETRATRQEAAPIRRL